MMLLGGLQGLSASYGKGSQNSTAKDTASKESTVSAGRTVSIESGKDTDIIGSQVKAEQVTANVAGNLHIESEQDSKEYHEEGKQIGASLGYNVASHQLSGFGSAGKSKTDSHYASVTEQAGIQAGKDGFDLTVGKETSLKGAVISSTAEKEKNQLTTGTLSWEDVENKANYKESGAGLTINTSKDAKYNEKGIIPAIPTGSKDQESSNTKSAIAEGTIAITDKAHQKQDVSRLNRDSKNSLNQLGEIFDKAKSNERQELAGLFGEMAFNQLHDAKLTPNQRSAWHALIGGIMGQLSNKDFLGGATAAGINEMLIKQIEKVSHGDPALMQWMSAAVGGITGELVSKNPQLGKSTSSNGTKNNDVAVAPIYALPALIVYSTGNSLELVKRIIDETGASINASGQWISDTGEYIGEYIQDLIVWAKSGRQLKRLPKKIIDNKGGEEWTRELKKETGKSKSDLYWNPKTGDVYSVPKRGGGEPEWVGNVKY